MKRQTKVLVGLLIVLVLALCLYGLYWRAGRYVTTEWTEYGEPPARDDLKLVDDRLEDKNPAFDEDLVDSRPLGDWEVNQSAAVIELDCPTIKPDVEAAMLVLRPSYAQVVKAAAEHGLELLPSTNLIDGAAKQFDDGLYAALDLACYQGKLGVAPAAPDFVKAVFDKLPAASAARPFLAAALELAGRNVPLKPNQEARKARLLAEFRRDEARSKPISFYNWTPELQQVWRFYRFLQREFQKDLRIPRAVAAVLKDNPGLRKDYRAVNGFYGRLTNPVICLPVDALIGWDGTLRELAKKRGARRATVAVFPPSTSRETELFDRLFPLGVPPHVNLMVELIRRIRSGEVKLEPGEKDGWYQYQVFALETMLLPSKGEERKKLLLTARYKKRLVEAFKALITKRRETHARSLGPPKSAMAKPLGEKAVRPRLRLEPSATFYLHTARGYAFLQNFLLTTVGKGRLAALHGLRKGGRREPDVAEELDAIRTRFYGFYLVACEDIGMRPRLLKDEPVDRPAAKKAALDWLEKINSDPDLALDTRVSLPIFLGVVRGKTRCWGTLGVRLAHLNASYVRPPKVRPKGKGGEWQEAEYYQLGNSRYVIPVDEFAEFELPGSSALTRAELRAICDRHKTKDKIIQALGGE